ncbi:hypothetical protein B0T25DRAFT_593168 [Lasiosphaeria hispida]|uniref:TauD/TfdA-like domain-containing protein n=1 Tax=Lasiosphaeria hispida TaxID=260671 RepID=A0AAJ0M910_9PEZI|nr:hypothetical protein B0T25DRAFT_593168 [Lasiosphaeria hispida]
MEFSSKELEDIQRVAGLFNLTVDELIQKSREASKPSTQSSPELVPVPSHHAASSSSRDALPARHLSHRDHTLAWQNVQVAHHQGSLDVDSFEIEEYLDQPSAPSATSDGAQDTIQDSALDEQIILLNPQTAWYDCDTALWSFGEPTEGNLSQEDDSPPEEDGAESYVPVTPMQLDSDPGSDSTAREERREKAEKALDSVGTEWAVVSSSPGSLSSLQTPMSPTSGSAEKRYHLIAPKIGRSASQSISQTSSGKIRKKRSPYQGTKKKDTHLTRQVHACVRCRMQRNRCIPDPNNARGPCLTCQQKTVRMSRLPCLRYMVTDSTLFRTSLDYMAFYKSHPMIGPHHGDFHLDRQWTSSPSKILCLGQLGAMHLKVELREFVPPANTTDVDLKGRPMYAVPWAIVDPDAAVRSVNEYIDSGMHDYLYEHLDDTDRLRWNIFQAAHRASIFPTPNRMLQKTLRLWVACRFIESKWRCWSDSGFADSEILASNPRDPFYDWDSLPPYLDYQIASVIIHRILTPLRKEVLRELQGTFNTHSPKDWFVTFLTSFILLQNYEMQMQFQQQFAARRKAKQLFAEGFNWGSPRVRRMARLDAEETDFMASCRDVVVQKAMGKEAIFLEEHKTGKTWGNLELKPSTLAYGASTHEWPAEMKGDLCWGPQSFRSGEDLALVLTEDEVSEVRAGLRHFNSLELYGSEVSPNTFPLPTLGQKLLRLAADIHSGKGFAAIRGLQPDEFSPEDNVLIFLGISSYIGAKRGRQDEDGNMLMHIRDAKLSKTPQHDRPIRYSARASTFHTDTFCDILALQTRSCALEGGRNILASSWTVYNKLMATHPEVCELLAQPIWPFDSRGKFFESSTRPLLFYHGGRVMMNLAREPLLGLEGVRRPAGLATLTQAQRDALDLVETIATQNQIVLNAEPGDLLFINNHAVLHSREAFSDAPRTPARYLVRAWLKNPALAWKLPRALQEGSSRIYDDNELGERWNIVDVPKFQFRLSERLTS